MQGMFSDFEQKINRQRLSNLRSLSIFASIVVSLLGFVFEFAYHDANILFSGLIISLLFTSNYYFSFRSRFYRKQFTNISYVSVFLLHFWEVYVA